MKKQDSSKNDRAKPFREDVNKNSNQNLDDKQSNSHTQDLKKVISTLNEKSISYIENLNKAVENLEEKICLLNSLPQDISNEIAEQAYKALDEKSFGFIKSQCADLEERIESLKSSIDLIEGSVRRCNIASIKKSLLQWLGMLILSSLLAALVSFSMMKWFPQRVSISTNGEVKIIDSEVNLWGKPNIKYKPKI